jgi:hypothetical protein
MLNNDKETIMTLKFKCTHFVCLATTCLISLVLAACDSEPKNALAQQQHFICKSLIDGFLKAEHLGQYELQHFQPIIQNAVIERNYTYRVSADNQMRLVTPQQKKLHFQCQHAGNQSYTVKLLDPSNNTLQTLVHLNLPPRDVLKQLTAYSLGNQTQ